MQLSMQRILLLLLPLMATASGYRTGDPVHTLLYLPHETTDVMRSQVPLFGVTRTVMFPLYDHQFSLGFEQGMWTIPWISSQSSNQNEQLEKITVKFVYSSNSGTIHAISKETTFSGPTKTTKVKQIPVEYIWVLEEPVDLQSGAIVMFLATLVISIIFFIQSCSVSDDEEEVVARNGAEDNHGLSYGGVSTGKNM